MWVYESGSDGWTAAGDIPEGVNHAGFVHIDRRLYIVGGFRETSFTPTGAIRIYDIAAGQWSDGAPMPTPRGAAAVVVANGKIHVIGGNVSSAGAVHEHERATVTNDNSVATHEVYDPTTNSWSRLAPMATSRNHLGAAFIGGKIHVVGGRSDGNFELTAHEVFDPATGEWTTAAPIPTGRSGIAVLERDGRMYVFGGEAQRGTFNEAERFDPATGRWEALAPMPTARHGLGAAVLAGNIHVVSGGPQPGMRFSSAHEVLSRD
jgi:N-acetylneuraminic acid mutarotase